MDKILKQVNAKSNGMFLQAGIGISILYCYAYVLREMVKKWRYEDTYSYGFLIPIISVYLIWLNRNEIKKVPMKPDFKTGIPVLISGLVMFIFGKSSRILLAQEISIVPTIIGIILILYGRSIFRIVWFPVFYLLFMVPLWDDFLKPLHLPFQLVSAMIGVKILNIFSIPVLQNSTIIELPNITLEVAQVCSGVNYLISVVAIGVPLCYLFLKSWPRRILLISLSVLIAALSNGLRVAGIALYSYSQGVNIVSNEIHGPFAIFRALGIAMIGYLVIFWGVWLLSDKKRLTNNIGSDVRAGPININTSGDNNISQSRNNYFFPLFSILLIVSAGTYNNFYKPSPVPLKMDFGNFPYIMKGWVGKDIYPPYDLVNFKKSGATDELSRLYINEEGVEVLLYVGYFDYQSQTQKLISYRTDFLFANSTPFKVDFGNYKLNEVNIYRKNGNSIVLYWFDVNGRKTNNRYLAKAYLMWDSMIKRKSNSAIIMLRTNTTNKENFHKSFFLYERFLKTIFPILKEFLPGNDH
jgi:EpsI family protein